MLQIDDKFLVEKGVRLLTLHRPLHRNALDKNTAELLLKALKEANEEEEVRVLVLTGAGDKAFCAGADVDILSQSDGSAMQLMGLLQEVFIAIRYLKKPMVAAVNGVAVGAGLGLLLSADFAVLSPNAKIGIPEIKRGLFPSLVVGLLLESLPRKLVNEIALLGDWITPENALRYGLVNRIVGPELCLAEAMVIAERLAGVPFRPLQLARESLIKSSDMFFKEGLSFLGGQFEKNLSCEATQKGFEDFRKKNV